ncbi:MAG: hypothetical protein ACYCYF_07115 [Anaerolineae bacterium]
MKDVGIEVRGRWYDLKLAEDQDGRPMWATSIPKTSQTALQVGDATYSSRIPEVQGVFAQPDLGGGCGQRNQVPSQHPAFDRYHYADGADASNGIGPGPETTTITKLTDAGPLSGAFQLAGSQYLLCGRKIALYDAGDGTISEVEDLGAGVVGYGGATFIREGAEASDQTSTGTGATDTIDGPQDQVAEKITPSASKDLGRVDLQLVRTDVVAVQTITISGIPTGGNLGKITYAGSTTAALAWNVSAADMQTALRALPGLSAVTVVLGDWVYTITFTGVVGLAVPLVLSEQALTGGTEPSALVAQARIGQAVTGNVQLAVQADYNGRPSGYDLAVSTVDARGLPTSAGTVAFRFDDDDRYFQEAVPCWLVLRAIGTTAAATVGWTRTTTGTQNGATSSDMGNSWTAAYKHYHVTYSKAITATAFVGKAQGAKLLYSSDGTTYTADSVYEAKHLVVFGDLLVRDCRASSAGAISWSRDGRNWSEAFLVGDPAIQITALLPMGSVLIVVKEDSIWAVDPTASIPEASPIYVGGRSTSNGPGASVWRGMAFVPFDGKLMGISGSLSAGFEIKQSIGPDSAPEWDAPFGAGRVVAVAGDRQCLYAAMSTSGAYRLFKSYDPLEGNWHGSIADLGTASAFNMMTVFDAGAANSPLLFYPTTSDNIGKIVCARTPNPWGDSAYRVSTSTGSLYHPWANGNAHVHHKAWLRVSQTFAQEGAAGYAEEMWDTLDGNGWRALEDGRLYQTGSKTYPVGLRSRILKRRTRITSGSATDYPVLTASGLTYAVRPDEGLRQYAFTLDARDGLSASALGEMLGLTGLEISESAVLAAMWQGTVRLRDPQGRVHPVLVLNATDVMLERRDGSKSAAVEVVGVSQ